MEHCDQEMYAQHDFQDDPYHSSVYSSDILSFPTPTSFVIPEQARQRFPPSESAFRSHHHHHHHEAEHVYNSPQLTLDPSTLDLRPNPCDDISHSANNPTGSSSTTPTGSLRISPYNLPALSSTGAVTRRKARAALEQLQIQTQVTVGSQSVDLQEQQQGSQQTQTQPHSFHSNHDPQHHLHSQTGEMHDVQMQQGELQMHVDGHNHSLINSIHHQQPSGLTQHSQLYSGLSDTPTSSSGYYLPSDTFSNSPVSTPPDASPHSDLQPISPTSPLGSSPSSTIPLSRSFRSGSLSLGMTANRSLSLITSTSSTGGSIGQPLSPSHLHGPPLSTHPHMHPTPYYINHGSGSPAYPSTPPASHHAQGSSSSSRSSGQTHYSLRGSPVPRAFGRHGRSSSYGTSSTMSVRSTSPTSSIITSLSGGGSTPSTSGHLASPISYGDNGDMQMPFGSAQDPPHPSTAHFPRAQSHPPAVIPNYPGLSHQHRKSYLGHESYAATRGTSYIDSPRDSAGWPTNMRPDTYIHTNPRLTDEEFQAQFPPKPLITRAPHRKQKLANSDRKAICMYAKQHPSARQEDIAARYNVERSTISKILKNKERWLGCPDDDAKVARKRKPRFDDLELVLKVWVEETRPQKIVLSDALIRSKAKEEARRLGILEDKFKASSGWLENFKHRVGIRKGKYIGRDHWQEGSESDIDDPNGQRFQDQRTNWSKSHSDETSKGNWDLSLMGSTSPLKVEGEQHIQQLSLPDVGGKQSGFLSEELNHAHSSPQVTDARLGSRHEHEDHRVGPIMRKTRSRTLAENKEAANASSSSPSAAELPNPSNLPASTIIESKGIASDSTPSNPSLSVIHMGTTLLSRPHDTSHLIMKDVPNSPIGRPSSRGASEVLGTALGLIGRKDSRQTEDTMNK